jgi:hypothetical protein
VIVVIALVAALSAGCGGSGEHAPLVRPASAQRSPQAADLHASRRTAIVDVHPL